MRNYIISAIAAAIVFPIAEASAFTTIGTVQAVSGHEVIIQEGDVSVFLPITTWPTSGLVRR